ncbi:DUF2634 domain-containing protein [Chakrabartyella piscis]|uniref:DUF2634 domain-containing protein n=1 Tax=Chakrabartyella piscis TaxID=2918914 RepID=UPI0029589272|nr:DUF2634 domain-containing protein [Chakrabartyella piscis]
MVPTTSSYSSATTVETTTYANKTYYLNETKSEIRGDVDSLDAVKQAIWKILQTERYQYLIYDWNYGVELGDLFGKSASFVIPELQRRITEALVWDDRIESVGDFTFSHSGGEVVAEFVVYTKYGEVTAESVVTI